jgi:hypothetical protein
MSSSSHQISEIGLKIGLKIQKKNKILYKNTK